jgi:hypothetical protein
MPPRCLIFNAAGNVQIKDLAGNVVVYTVYAGQRLDFRGALYVMATNTTVAANSIVAWW